MTEHTREIVERYISIRPDGAIEWESVLDAHLGAEVRKRILDLVADNIVGESRIDWAGVWKDYREGVVNG